MIESNASTGERVLHRRGDPIGVAVGGDRDGTTVVHLDQGGADVLRYRVRVTVIRHLAVLYVPPHRRLRSHILLIRSRRHRRRHGGGHGPGLYLLALFWTSRVAYRAITEQGRSICRAVF